jgi:hypothetical protein
MFHFTDFSKGRRIANNIDVVPDISNQNIINISQGKAIVAKVTTTDQKVDQETVNLIDWLVNEQGTTPEIALKKAVVTAAYIRDVTSNQMGQLLVRYPDGSIREIFLK